MNATSPAGDAKKLGMDDKQKILAVLKIPPPITGATVMNAAVFNAKQKWENGSVIFRTVSYAENIQDLGSFKLRKIIKYFRLLFSITGFLLKNRQTILYFQTSIFGISFLRDSLVLLVAKLLGKKRLVHLHGKGIKEYASTHRWYRFWFRFLLQNQYAIVLTENQKQDIQWMKWSQIWVIPNGSIEVPIQKSGDIEQPFQWLFLSNLLFSKGIDDVLQLACSMKNNANWQGHIIGKEGDRDEKYIAHFIKENQLQEKLFYHGALFGEEKWQRLAQSDVLIFPTYNEAFGLVAIEAMSVGIPVIAYREGGLTEIIRDEKTGFLISKGDWQSVRDRLLQYQDNPSLMKQHGQEGRHVFLSNFTMDCFIGKLYAVFDEISQH